MTAMEYLESLVKITQGKQKEFYAKQLNSARECTISPTPSDIDTADPQIKQCYNNSFFVVMNNPEALYVEGVAMFHGIPIDHAWNRIGDTYFDVTSEGPLKGKSQFTDYVSYLELGHDKLLELGEELGHSGPFMGELYRMGKLNEVFGARGALDRAMRRLEISKKEMGDLEPTHRVTQKFIDKFIDDERLSVGDLVNYSVVDLESGKCIIVTVVDGKHKGEWFMHGYPNAVQRFLRMKEPVLSILEPLKDSEKRSYRLGI